MRLKTKSRSVYTFPVVVPPVTHKSSILPDALGPVWELVERRLIEANEVIVFGYSCPALDFESANLLRRSLSARQSATGAFHASPTTGCVVARFIGRLHGRLPKSRQVGEETGRPRLARLPQSLILSRNLRSALRALTDNAAHG